MIVCVCHNVSEKQIKCTAEEFELRSLEELQEAVDICKTCRKCEHCIKQVLDDCNCK